MCDSEKSFSIEPAGELVLGDGSWGPEVAVFGTEHRHARTTVRGDLLRILKGPASLPDGWRELAPGLCLRLVGRRYEVRVRGHVVGSIDARALARSVRPAR